MRSKITRKLIVNTVCGYCVKVTDGIPTIENLEPITLYGNVTKANAEKALKKAYANADSVHVGKIDSKETVFAISVDDFIAHAEPVADEASEN